MSKINNTDSGKKYEEIVEASPDPEIKETELMTDDVQPHIEQVAPATTAVGRLITAVDVLEALNRYVEKFKKYADPNRTPSPPWDPQHADEFTVRDGMVLWLDPKSKYTEVTFIFVTREGFQLHVTEVMEVASADRLEQHLKNIENTIAEARRSREGRSLIIH